MRRATKTPPDAADRKALRTQVRRMYNSFNRGEWAKCFALVDPRLRDSGKVQEPAYTESLRRFQAAYGTIEPWHVRISLHPDASSNKHDPRPFAYVYVVWQDR